MKVVQETRGLGLQIRNYFTPISYGLRGTVHAHCQFCDFRLKSCDDYRVSMELVELEHENPQDRASDR